MEETGLPGLKPISVVDRCSYLSKVRRVSVAAGSSHMLYNYSYRYESESIACRTLFEALHRTEPISLC